MDVKGRMMDVAGRVDGRLGRFKWHNSDTLGRIRVPEGTDGLRRLTTWDLGTFGPELSLKAI